jgi:hypothetical protein
LDALYLFGQTVDNQASEFQRALEFVSRVGAMVVPDGPAECGYPGGEAFAAEVASFFPGEVVRMPLVGSRITNTYSEAQGLLQLSLQRGWRDVGALSFPSHLYRGFRTIASVAIREDPERKVRFWSIAGVPLRWDEVIVHSQGVQRKTRAALILDELDKIESYPGQAPAHRILDWMDQR